MTDVRACILSISGTALTCGEVSLLSRVNPWGVILMGRSCQGPEQVKALTDSICAATRRRTLVFIDQEGGRVRRLRPPAWPDFPAPGVYAAIYANSPEAAREAVWLHHRLIAAELAPIGIRADCAPVVDLRHPGAHDIVGDRSFGDSPDQVALLARAALDGLRDGGVAGVIKHMPGHGRAQVDSHEAMPVVRATRRELADDIAPFKAVHDAPMGMTAHLAYTAFDGERAATVSEAIIGGVIRGQIGFDGLLMSDDLGMKALGNTLSDKASRAHRAGCDVALHCSGFLKDPEAILAEMTEVAEASPVLSGESLRRAEAAERATTHLKAFDKMEGRARLERLLSSAGGSSSAIA